MQNKKVLHVQCTKYLKWIDLSASVCKSTLWRLIWIFEIVRNAYMQMILKYAV